MTDWLDVLGLALVVAGVLVLLGIGFALLAAGAGVLLVSRGLYLRRRTRRPAGSEVA